MKNDCRYRRLLQTLLLVTLWFAAEVSNVSAAPIDDTSTTHDQRIKQSAAIISPKNIDDLKTMEQRVQKILTKVIPATIAVRVGNGSGSGVIVSEDGLVMTAGHVVTKPDQAVTFTFADGKTAKGKTLGVYLSADAGLMKITDPGPWPFAEKADSRTLRQGEWCVALGHPLGYQKGRPPVVRIGRVLRRQDGIIQTDCPIVSGDSGGPLFDLQGKVIGINSRIGTSTDQNLHVAVDIFRDNWDRLVKAEAWQDDLHGRNGSEVKMAFRAAVAEAARCTVRIKCNQQETALGTIVGPDGWVVTKASELRGKIVCCLADGRELEARVVGLCEAFDLAMLKIEVKGLPMISWIKDQPVVGQWLAAPGPGEDPLAVGILSVPQRRIPPISGVMGVAMKVADDVAEAQIAKVYPGSPAEKAELKEGDVLTAVNGKQVRNTAEFMTVIKQYRAGELVQLGVKRGSATITISLKLANLEMPGTQRRDMQNRMGVGVSNRRDDFPAVLQHDTVLRPADCGGPLVNLEGEVVGVNIARGGRAETYCIPTDVLLGLMYDLMSGRLDPKRQSKMEKTPQKKVQTMAEKETDKVHSEGQKEGSLPKAEEKQQSPEARRTHA